MILNDTTFRKLDQVLAGTDALLADAYPGDDGRRQPVHTVYVPADQFSFDTAQRWPTGLRQFNEGRMRQLADLVLDHTSDPAYRDELAQLVERKRHRTSRRPSN